MRALLKRNLLVFFRDKSAVFFSLLASFIIVGLYVLFLGNQYSSGFSELGDVTVLMDSWVMAGLLATTSVTTTMGAFSIMVNDRELKISKDFYSSPVKRRSLAGGYVLSALIIGLIMTLVTLVLAELYIVSNGGSLLSIEELLKVLGIIVLADLTNASMMFLITSFFASSNAFATASTVVGTLIGFITGIYLPIGSLPEAVQWVVKLFPTSHAASLLRQVMTEGHVSSLLSGVPAEYVLDFKHTLGITFQFGSTEVSAVMSMLILVGSAFVFFILAVWNFSRKRKG